MSTFTLAGRHATLIDRVITRSVATDALLILAGVIVTAALAQVVVPLWPVPITGQSLAVLLVGATLGATRGAASMLLYALLGAVGLPIFHAATSGWNIVAGPTGGYIVGFVLAAWLTGWCAERQWDRHFIRAMAVFGAGTLLTFACGIPWLALSLGLSPAEALEAGLYPFIVGGIIKALIAAVVMRFTWVGVARIRR